MVAFGIESRSTRRPVEWSIWLPAAFLTVVVAGCFVLPLVSSIPSPVNGSIESAGLPMWSAGHIFGTDPVGNDVLSQILYGGRTSIEIGIASNLIGLVAGGLTGLVAGYCGGATQTVIMRLLDVLIAFPTLVLALVIAAYLGPGELHIIFALSFFSVPAYARLAYPQTLRLREREFISAAKIAGVRSRRIVLTHVVPTVFPRLATFCSLGVAFTIMFEAALSYLGLGVRPPTPSLGAMIAQGQEYLTTRPALVLIPSVFLFVTVLALNLLSDGIRTWSATR